MTRFDFENLSEKSKQNTITQHGKLLVNCLQGKFLIEMFGLFSFFVKAISYDGGLKDFLTYKDLANLKLSEIPVPLRIAPF